jgi:hypothetical protein
MIKTNSLLRLGVVAVMISISSVVDATSVFESAVNQAAASTTIAQDQDQDHERKLDTFFTKPPTPLPTPAPTPLPTETPTEEPTSVPTLTLTDSPTNAPVAPTSPPSKSPTKSPTSVGPTAFPTTSPTVCSNSYLDSESLNIALVVDLSYSTYEKQFSSTVDIGDVNGDGKGNTILDAQVVAIQDMLTSIAISDTLNNSNTEIALISFETDSESHGVWKPLNDDNESFNTELMEYIKMELRAPTSNGEVFNTNNGFTNFDAALDRTVTYFENTASPERLNLLVFLSDGEPNVRGDGDNEMYCADTTVFWNGNNDVLQCSDLNLQPGEMHTICRGDDPDCVENEPYQDCVRGPTECLNSDAVTQYDSEIASLVDLNVARLAIGVGDESNVSQGSALWMIDDNPAKDLGVLPIQALSLEELSTALSHLCILNTDPPTGSPTASPSDSPTKSPAPSPSPTDTSSSSPTSLPSYSPTTGAPTKSPTKSPTVLPTASPTASPTTVSPSASPSEAPSGSYFPSSAPTDSPTKSPAPSNAPSSTPTASPSSLPTASPSSSPTTSPSSSSSNGPTSSPTPSPTITPTTSGPTFLLPDCYDGPKLIEKDSSDVQMCYYNPDMVEINDMSSTEVTIAINNVWTTNTLPEQMQVFVHTNGIDSVTNNGEGFQCLDNDGSDIDIEGDNEFTVECYQESENDPFFAVIDVVITDSIICGSNEVSHPCYPDDEPILESCSWRIVIPCDYNKLCTEEPSSNPSAAPILSLSDMPSDEPSLSASSVPTTASPTSSPTAAPTAAPTDSTTTESPTDVIAELFPPTDPPVSPPIDVNGGDDDDDDTFLPPLGPEVCPEDILLLKHDGVTTYPTDAVRIISQDTTTVTVELQQSFTTSTIDYMFYQYNINSFDYKCYEENNVEGGDYIEITIECTHTSQIGLLEFWVADDIENGVLSENDNATIPKCCHPDIPEDTPVTKYYIEIKCVTECPEVYE